MLGLIGPNGAARPTTFNLLLGLRSFPAGDSDIRGKRHHKVVRLTESSACLRANVSAGTMLAALSVRETSESRSTRCRRHSRREQSGGENQASRIDEHLDQFGLLAFRDVRAGDLSYGQLKRLGRCHRSLYTTDSPALLDEPAAGLNGAESASCAATWSTCVGRWGSRLPGRAQHGLVSCLSRTDWSSSTPANS
ncbi:ATP-binding cassette domain-containing protein [Rhodococcus opacus]|nr:ATP-binding cassette domain-containing protein [Rhodococcus opacus]